MKQSTEAICPVCGNKSESVMPLPNWGEMRKCTDCGLYFANPMTLPMSSVELYTKAYNGEVGVTDMHHFATRIRHRRTLLWADRYFPPHTTSLTLKWIQNHLPVGATVLDIGCGPGYALHALRRRGYNAIGIEPGEKPASILKSEGFQVWHGTLENYPGDWPVPDAVTSFFMLHHLPDPEGFFSMLRHKFPLATILISDHHHNASVFVTRGARQRAMPPRFLTWWTGPSLERAFVRAGYTTKVRELRYSIRQGITMGVVHAFMDAGTSIPDFLTWMLRGDKAATKDVETEPSGYPTSFWQRFRRFTGIPWSVWAVGLPTPQNYPPAGRSDGVNGG